MFAAPARDDDLSLTVSRIAAKDGAQSIFLDLQCRKTTYGQEFCASEAVRQIRRDFRSAVQPAE
jgi:tRNA-dihydrouridine synthase